jgi:hypothetical protein
MFLRMKDGHMHVYVMLLRMSLRMKNVHMRVYVVSLCLKGVDMHVRVEYEKTNVWRMSCFPMKARMRIFVCKDMDYIFNHIEKHGVGV